MIPHSGKQGHQILSKMKKQLKRTLLDDIKTTIGNKSTKLSAGKTKRHIVERIKDHNSKYNSSHLLKYARGNGNFLILGNNYQSNFKQKIRESLFIRQLKTMLNVNEKSLMLHLFN